MNTYIGTKIIRAQVMTRLDYNILRGWKVPDDENPTDEGYLVEYLDGGKANVRGYEGYVSWSPKDVFDRAYKPAVMLDFGGAIRCLKNGLKVARKGWNGKDMWLSLSCDGSREISAEFFWSKHNREFAMTQPNQTAMVLPSITMKTATGEILMGWLASQTDMLAEDWVIV